MSFISNVYSVSLFEKMKLDSRKDFDSQFKELLKGKDLMSIIALNSLINKITCFDEECIKYFSFLNEKFKHEMNNLDSTSINKILVINSALSNFVTVFYNKFQAYNDKHKSITNQLPNFLQVFFKLLKGKQEEIMRISFEKNKKFIQSFAIILMTFLNFYPTLMRTYQKQIEELISNVFNMFLLHNSIQLNDIKSFIILYSMLFRLSPSPETKFNTFLESIVNNIEKTLTLFQPSEEKNNPTLLFFKNIKSENLLQGIKIINVYFEVLKSLFILIVKNNFVKANYSCILKLCSDILSKFKEAQPSSIIVSISGLTKKQYKIFMVNVVDNIIQTLCFHLANFPLYFSCYYQTLSKVIDSVLLNDEVTEEFYLYQSTLKLFNLSVLKLSSYLPKVIDEIIFKFIYSNFPSLYFELLEKNDKTVVQFDNTYFKLGNKKKEISILQQNKQNSKGLLFSKFSTKEHEALFISYLKIISSYVVSEHHSSNKNSKEIISGLIDMLILPCASKYIFYLNSDIKREILSLIEQCVLRKKFTINNGKLYNFLKGFCSQEDSLKTKCENIIWLKGLNWKDTFNESSMNNITKEIIDFNFKFSEIIKNNYEAISNLNTLLGKKRESSDEEEKPIEKKEHKKPKIKEEGNKGKGKRKGKGKEESRKEEIQGKLTKIDKFNEEEKPEITRNNEPDEKLLDDINIPDIVL